MKSLPIIAETHAPTSAPSDAKTGEVTVSELERPALASPFPFFSFSYSFNEISLVDGRTRVRSRQARLVNGKLQTEDFDGILDGAAYAQAVAETQRLLAEQTRFLLRQFSHFLPFWGR